MAIRPEEETTEPLTAKERASALIEAAMVQVQQAYCGADFVAVREVLLRLQHPIFRAIRQAEKDEHRLALEEACRAMCVYCRADLPIEDHGDGRFYHPGTAPDDTGDKGWWVCEAAPIRSML